MIVVIISQSVLWAIAAVLLLVSPRLILDLFDVVQAPSVHALARVFGSELAGLTLASYFTRHLVATPRRKALALAYTASNTLGFLATFVAVMSGALALRPRRSKPCARLRYANARLSSRPSGS
jgi:hypothetical protein